MITFPGRNTTSAEVVPGRKEINICPHPGGLRDPEVTPSKGRLGLGRRSWQEDDRASAGARPGIRPVIRMAAEASHAVPVPIALRRTGVRFLASRSRQGLGRRYLRPPGGQRLREAEQSAKAGREG